MWAKLLMTLGAGGSVCAAAFAGAATGAELASRPLIAQAPAAETKDSLFGDVPPVAGADKPATESSRGWTGYISGELARDYKSPEHWSNARLRADVSRQGQFSSNVKWK